MWPCGVVWERGFFSAASEAMPRLEATGVRPCRQTGTHEGSFQDKDVMPGPGKEAKREVGPTIQPQARFQLSFLYVSARIVNQRGSSWREKC
jgi:hypothetical protein